MSKVEMNAKENCKFCCFIYNFAIISLVVVRYLSKRRKVWWEISAYIRVLINKENISVNTFVFLIALNDVIPSLSLTLIIFLLNA